MTKQNLEPNQSQSKKPGACMRYHSKVCLAAPRSGGGSRGDAVAISTRRVLTGTQSFGAHDNRHQPVRARPLNMLLPFWQSRNLPLSVF